MLAVILTILRIVGIVLLVILGVVLLALLLVLFVPIRYGAKASYDERPLANATASWLCHLVSFRLDYEEKLSYSLRVLGINVFRNRYRDSSGENDDTGFRETEIRMEESPPPHEDIREFHEEMPKESRREIREEAREEAAEEYEEQIIFEETTESEERLEHPVTELDIEERDERLTDEKILREWDRVEEFGEELREESPLRHIISYAQRFFRSIKEFFVRIGHLIKERVRYLRVELWEAFIKRRDWLIWLLTEPANVATRHLLWRQLKKLLNHIKPRHVEGDVKFGFDDPYITGQVLVAISPFYGFYGGNITVTPVFDESIAEGRIRLKGRVRIFTVLAVIIRMLMDKNFRFLLNRFLNS